jgi:hypothetical protein
MKIKDSLLLASLVSSVGLIVPAHASPLVSIGDNVDVFFNGSSSVQWMSNVFYEDSGEQDDYRFTVSPGFEVNVGRGLSNLDLSIITRYDIIRYDQLSDLDNELFHIKAIGSYQTSRWDVNGLVSFDQEQSASGLDGGTGKGRMVKSDNTRANLEGEYRISPKFSVGSGVRYYDREYTNDDQLVDRESFTIPVDVFYELTPKVDLSVGYTYKTSKIGKSELGNSTNGYEISSYDQDTHFFNVGARGNLLPKLTGFFKVGYTSTSPDDSTIHYYPTNTETTYKRNSQGTMGLDANFTYLATPKVTTTLALHRGFGVGGEGQTTENTSAKLGASYAINTNYSASANFGYTLRDYQDGDNRKDHIYNAGVRLSYVPNQYWQFSTGYTYADNDSDRDGQSYEAHMIDLSASLRY